jgi:hypothetical protein
MTGRENAEIWVIAGYGVVVIKLPNAVLPPHILDTISPSAHHVYVDAGNNASARSGGGKG